MSDMFLEIQFRFGVNGVRGGHEHTGQLVDTVADPLPGLGDNVCGGSLAVRRVHRLSVTTPLMANPDRAGDPIHPRNSRNRSDHHLKSLGLHSHTDVPKPANRLAVEPNRSQAVKGVLDRRCPVVPNPRVRYVVATGQSTPGGRP